MTPEGQLTCAAQLTAKRLTPAGQITHLVTPIYHAEALEKAEALAKAETRNPKPASPSSSRRIRQ